MVLTGLLTACAYTTGPDAKYASCGHLEYADTITAGAPDTLHIHLACPKK